MTNFNRVILAGRLTRDPELRHTPKGDPIAAFSLAVDYGWGEKKSPVFLDCALFGKRAEGFCAHNSKGSNVLIEGALKPEKWTDKKTGEERSKVSVAVDQWTFAGGGPRDGKPQAPAQGSLMTDPEPDDVPW